MSAADRCGCGRIQCERTKIAARAVASMRCGLRQIEAALRSNMNTMTTLRTIEDTTRNALADHGQMRTVDCRECGSTGIGGSDEDGWLDCGCCGRYGVHTAEAPDVPHGRCLVPVPA